MQKKLIINNGNVYEKISGRFTSAAEPKRDSKNNLLV